MSLYYLNDGKSVTLTAPLGNTYSLVLTRSSLLFYFRYFCDFVEDLTFQSQPHKRLFDTKIHANLGIWWSLAIMIEPCKCLKALQIKYFKFEYYQVHQLQILIEWFENLIELEFIHCTGITNNWRRGLGFPKVMALTLSAANQLSVNIFARISEIWLA